MIATLYPQAKAQKNNYEPAIEIERKNIEENEFIVTINKKLYNTKCYII